MKNIFKVGKVGFLFLATVIFLFTVIPQNASAAIKKNNETYEELFESLGGVDQETIDLFNELDKYRVESEGGSFKVDVTTAELDGVQSEVLNVMNILNAMLTGDEEASEIMPLALFPIGSYGNYCGKGNNGYDKTAIDNLDSACRTHDMCFTGFNSSSAACNQVFIGALLPIVQATTAHTTKGAYARAAVALFLNWV